VKNKGHAHGGLGLGWSRLSADRFRVRSFCLEALSSINFSDHSRVHYLFIISRRYRDRVDMPKITKKTNKQEKPGKKKKTMATEGSQWGVSHPSCGRPLESLLLNR